MLTPELPTAASSTMVGRLRAVANLIADAARVNVPPPQTVHVGTWNEPTLIMSKFEDVEEWGLYLEAPVERWFYETTEHIATTSDQGDVYGIDVRVTTNRPIAVGVVSS